MKRRVLILLLIASVAFIFWLFTPLLSCRALHDHQQTLHHLALLGNSYGAFNAFVAAAAFIALVYTIFQQEKTIRQQSVKLDDQSKLMGSQLRVMQLSATGSMLPELIKQTDEELSRVFVDKGGYDTMSKGMILMRIRGLEPDAKTLKLRVEKQTTADAKRAATAMYMVVQNKIDMLNRMIDYKELLTSTFNDLQTPYEQE